MSTKITLDNALDVLLDRVEDLPRLADRAAQSERRTTLERLILDTREPVGAMLAMLAAITETTPDKVAFEVPDGDLTVAVQSLYDQVRGVMAVPTGDLPRPNRRSLDAAVTGVLTLLDSIETETANAVAGNRDVAAPEPEPEGQPE